jgi:hypothetical protein
MYEAGHEFQARACEVMTSPSTRRARLSSYVTAPGSSRDAVCRDSGLPQLGTPSDVALLSVSHGMKRFLAWRRQTDARPRSGGGSGPQVLNVVRAVSLAVSFWSDRDRVSIVTRTATSPTTRHLGWAIAASGRAVADVAPDFLYAAGSSKT